MLFIDFNLLLLLFAVIFFLGIIGIVNYSKNFIHFMVYMELIYLNISFFFIIISNILFDYLGELFSFFILSIAAAEAALGFSLLVLMLNKIGSILLKDFHNFRI
jgi:NADH-quinone oxidoreductase subunit K